MELLLGIGFAAKELFDYNREIFQFDQDQRLERELLRLEMQVKRFELFREDVRDLVELTVGKMEMYHLVGSLILQFLMLFYTSGRVQIEGRLDEGAPAFICAQYWLAAGSSFVYVLLSVWLSMHASIASHSFGVRLLTRFVRLPIPSAEQFNSLNARLTDFERQRVSDMLRLPVLAQVQQWSTRFGKADDLLGGGVHGFGEEAGVHGAAVFLPGKHIQLFRRLQAKWQCFDAYSRVCMSLGGILMLQTMSYFLICQIMIEYHSPMTCFAVIALFQCTGLAIIFLDVAEVHRWVMVGLQLMGCAPVYMAAIGVHLMRDRKLHSKMKFGGAEKYFSWLSFFLVSAWLEALLQIAWPSEDLATLPRRFRAVLFLDVFSFADDADAESREKPKVETSTNCEDVVIPPEKAVAADEAVTLAEAALRRWEAIPEGTEEATSYQAVLRSLRRDVMVWRKALNAEAARRAERRGDQEALALLEPDTREWRDLSESEQEEDPWAGKLLGPFHSARKAGKAYCYDVEGRQFVWRSESSDILTVEDVRGLVVESEKRVREVLGGGNDSLLFAGEESQFHLPYSHFHSESSQEYSQEEDEGEHQHRVHHPKHEYFQVQRLPWRVLKWATRVLEVAWCGCGTSYMLQDLEAVPRFEPNPARRLEPKDPDDLSTLPFSFLSFHSTPMQAWPGGAYFSPGPLSCAAPFLPPGEEGLLFAWHGGLHWAAHSGRGLSVPRELDVLQGLDPASAVAVSSRVAALPHLAVSLASEASRPAVQLWRGSRAVQLDLAPKSRPWRLLAAAAFPCDILAWHPLEGRMEHCLVLAGWDGRALPLAVVPVSGADGRPSEPFLAPSFDLLAEAAATTAPAPAISALHLEASGVLWAWLADGTLQTWDVLLLRRSQQWRPRWLGQVESFKPAGLCIRQNGTSKELVVLGESLHGLQLLKAVLPVSHF